MFGRGVSRETLGVRMLECLRSAAGGSLNHRESTMRARSRSLDLDPVAPGVADGLWRAADNDRASRTNEPDREAPNSSKRPGAPHDNDVEPALQRRDYVLRAVGDNPTVIQPKLTSAFGEERGATLPRLEKGDREFRSHDPQGYAWDPCASAKIQDLSRVGWEKPPKEQAIEEHVNDDPFRIARADEPLRSLPFT